MTVGEKTAREELAKRVDALLGGDAGAIRFWSGQAELFREYTTVLDPVRLTLRSLSESLRKDLNIFGDDPEPLLDASRKLLELARHLLRLAALGMIDADVQKRVVDVFCTTTRRETQGGPHNRKVVEAFPASVKLDDLAGWMSPKPSLPPLAWTEAHYRYEITALDARLDEIRRMAYYREQDLIDRIRDERQRLNDEKKEVEKAKEQYAIGSMFPIKGAWLVLAELAEDDGHRNAGNHIRTKIKSLCAVVRTKLRDAKHEPGGSHNPGMYQINDLVGAIHEVIAASKAEALSCFRYNSAAFTDVLTRSASSGRADRMTRQITKAIADGVEDIGTRPD